MSCFQAKGHYLRKPGLFSDIGSPTKVDCLFDCNLSELKTRDLEEELEENLKRLGAPAGEMFQGFPGDLDTGSRGSSSPSLEYLSSVDSFGSPTTTSAPTQECASTASALIGPADSSSSSSIGGGTAAAAAAAAAAGISGAGGLEMPGSFVPTVTAITTSQDLQWMVQPTLVSSVAPGQQGGGDPSSSVAAGAPPSTTMTQPGALGVGDPYDLPGPSFSSSSAGTGPGFSPPPPGSDTPGPVRPSRARSRRSREESLTPEEEEKRRVRRERNKQAAAKCRNRRRELTDKLQGETDILEEEKAELEAEISELQKEKERLEFVLVAHQPTCKMPYQEHPHPQQHPQQHQPQHQHQLPPSSMGLQQQQHQHQLLTAHPQLPAAVSVVGLSVKDDSFYLPPAYSSHLPQQITAAPTPGTGVTGGHHHHPQQAGMIQEVAFSTSFYGQVEVAQGSPCPPAATPAAAAAAAAAGGGGGGGGGGVMVGGGGGGGVNNHETSTSGTGGCCNPSYTSSFVFSYPEGVCGAIGNHWTSSSEQSSDSLNSPSLLAL